MHRFDLKDFIFQKFVKVKGFFFFGGGGGGGGGECEGRKLHRTIFLYSCFFKEIFGENLKFCRKFPKLR